MARNFWTGIDDDKLNESNKKAQASYDSATGLYNTGKDLYSNQYQQYNQDKAAGDRAFAENYGTSAQDYANKVNEAGLKTGADLGTAAASGAGSNAGAAAQQASRGAGLSKSAAALQGAGAAGTASANAYGQGMQQGYASGANAYQTGAKDTENHYQNNKSLAANMMGQGLSSMGQGVSGQNSAAATLGSNALGNGQSGWGALNQGVNTAWTVGSGISDRMTGYKPG